MTIRTNSERLSIYNQRGWKRSDPIPEHIYDIRKSLVENHIITHTEIIKCSIEFISKIERDLPNPNRPRRLKRCHYVNRCPICNHLRTLYVEKEMTPYRQVLLDNGGKNILMTFKLRHKNDSLLKLQNVLKESIKKLKDDNIWKNKLFPSKYRLYVKTEFEISWSSHNGFHPHCHLQIGTTNPMESEEIKSLVSPVWKKIVTDVLDANPTMVEDFINSDENKRKKKLGGFMGQIMKASKGQANPQQVNQILLQKLNELL